MPRARSSRASRSPQASEGDVTIPDKLYFRIGEVSELVRTKPFVLRYWETEFPTLKPIKSKSGHRLYRRQDVEMVLEIKRLLYERGFTIEGARKQLSNHSETPTEQKDLFRSTLEVAELKAIRRELQSVLTMLSRKC
jgi:DNA-binding transcriptional MerR regulator